jgi:hypothetical protein
MSAFDMLTTSLALFKAYNIQLVCPYGDGIFESGKTGNDRGKKEIRYPESWGSKTKKNVKYSTIIRRES